MSDRDDAAPFVILKSHVEDLKRLLDEDFSQCTQLLDQKLSSLIREPECTDINSPHIFDANAAFAKSKYVVFASVQSCFKGMEDKWKNAIDKMKEEFLESLTIFLGATKLEVKFPSKVEAFSLVDRISTSNKGRKKNLYPSLEGLVAGSSSTLEMEIDDERDEMHQSAFEFMAAPEVVSVRVTKVPVRRKTMCMKPPSNNYDTEDETTLHGLRTRSKRKTSSSSSTNDGWNSSTVVSPKRLKHDCPKAWVPPVLALSPPKSFNFTGSELADKTISESPDKYGYDTWTPLQSSKPPKQPGVYELKVWRAKKTAFIGCANDLFQQFSLHNDGKNSGHKHLDKFLERNLNDVQVRYEIMPTLAAANAEVKSRIKQFVDKFKSTPAYN